MSVKVLQELMEIGFRSFSYQSGAFIPAESRILGAETAMTGCFAGLLDSKMRLEATLKPLE